MQAAYLPPDPTVDAEPTTPRRRRAWVLAASAVIVLALVATGIALVLRAVGARDALNQLEVLPGRTVCNGKPIPFSPATDDNLGAGFMVRLARDDKAMVCQVSVKVNNRSSHAVEIEGYSMPFMAPGGPSGSPMQVYARKGLTTDVETVDDMDALITEDSFTVAPGESQTIEWQLEMRDRCQDSAGITVGYPLIVLHTKILGHHADVDRGAAMQFKYTQSRIGKC